MRSIDRPHETAAHSADSLRVLARSTRVLEHPSDSYQVIGELLEGVRSLQQVLNQLARQHRDLQLAVRDHAGNALAGRTAAVTAMDRLRQAAGLLELVESRLDQASQASGRIVWPEKRPEDASREQPRPERLLSPVPASELDADLLGQLPVVEIGR